MMPIVNELPLLYNDSQMNPLRSMDLRLKVREAYSAAADNPQADHPFPVGRQFAESLGYHRDLLDRLPNICVDAFAGVSNVAIFADLFPGATVLDLGCGAGLDSLVAMLRVGPGGESDRSGLQRIDAAENPLCQNKEPGCCGS